MTIVACHQPNFLPWLGYFAKVARADTFILLDDVQFTQGANKHNWTTRVRVLGSNGPIWLSVPVLRSGRGPQLVGELRADDPARWRPRMLRTLDESYRKAQHAKDVLPAVIEVLARSGTDICQMNIECIRLLSKLLRLKTSFVRSSALCAHGVATERLVNLTRAAGGRTYLSGDGAAGYQDTDVFAAAGIELRQLGFRPTPYPQRSSDFVPGLSIIDALCNIGCERTRAMLESGEPSA